ncbi:MAG: hypothetical protein L6R40_002396 [Gallowayella cf. fulva]|nr:MAG: hypothetical protein L6R40_002396 [Xanthomendoza cf. fulva]
MATDYSKKKNAELEELLKSRFLPHTGKKAELIARLQQSDKDAAAKPSPTKPTTTTTSTSKSDIPPEDEIDWDDDAIAAEIPTTNTSKTDIPPKSASTPAAAVALAAGGTGQSANPVAVPNQIPTDEPFKTDDISVKAPGDPIPETKAASDATAKPTTEESAATAAPAKPPTDYTAHIPLTSTEAELEKRRKRAERFALPSDAESLKKLERAQKFGGGGDAEKKPVMKGLDEALPERKKRGRGGDDEGAGRGGGGKRVRGGGGRRGGERSRSKSKGRNGEGGGKDGKADGKGKEGQKGDNNEAKAAQRKRDLEKAEERKKRFAAGGA